MTHNEKAAKISAALELLKEAGYMATPMMTPGGNLSNMVLRYDIPVSATVPEVGA